MVFELCSGRLLCHICWSDGKVDKYLTLKNEDGEVDTYGNLDACQCGCKREDTYRNFDTCGCGCKSEDTWSNFDKLGC